MKNSSGQSLGFGFVSFKEHQSALKAIKELHGWSSGAEGTAPGGLYVRQAMPKSQRQAEVQR